MSPIDPKRIEILDPMMIRVWRAKFPAVRVDLALASSQTVRDVMSCGIRRRYPDWSVAQIEAEVARRILRGSD